ncbi:MAG: hypothetical protein GY749_26705 [Desulfobacteraceae bacterium]|nr:hypothetical protein [Desulfobacteraceae bacterium]
MECFECGCPAIYNYYIIPKSLGGTKTVPLCEGCYNKVCKYCIGQNFHETALSLQEILKKYEPRGDFDKEVTDSELNENIHRLQEILGKYS